MKDEKSVAEKAKEKALAMKTGETKIARLPEGGGTIGTIMGIEPEDINMPYVYVVQANSKHALTESGKKVEAGKLFHGTKNKSYDSLEVLVAFAKKGKAVKKDYKSGEESEVPAYRAVMLPVDNLYSPFVMTFKEMGLWYGWKPYLSKLTAEGVTNLDRSVIITTDEKETAYGSTVYVPVIELGEPTTDEQKASMKSALERFGGAVDQLRDVEGDEEKPEPISLGTEEDELNLDDLAGKI